MQRRRQPASWQTTFHRQRLRRTKWFSLYYAEHCRFVSKHSQCVRSRLRNLKRVTTTIEEKKSCIVHAIMPYIKHMMLFGIGSAVHSACAHTPSVSFDFVRFGLHDFISLAHFRRIVLFSIQIRCWYLASFHFTSSVRNYFSVRWTICGLVFGMCKWKKLTYSIACHTYFCVWHAAKRKTKK